MVELVQAGRTDGLTTDERDELRRLRRRVRLADIDGSGTSDISTWRATACGSTSTRTS